VPPCGADPGELGVGVRAQAAVGEQPQHLVFEGGVPRAGGARAEPHQPDRGAEAHLPAQILQPHEDAAQRARGVEAGQDREQARVVGRVDARAGAEQRVAPGGVEGRAGGAQPVPRQDVGGGGGAAEAHGGAAVDAGELDEQRQVLKAPGAGEVPAGAGPDRDLLVLQGRDGIGVLGEDLGLLPWLAARVRPVVLVCHAPS
ncbi:MAG: hypothetical protein ACK559_19960, partial [bacterium]